MGNSGWHQARFCDLIDDDILEIGDGFRAKLQELGGDGPIFLRAGHVRDTHIDFTGVDRFQIELNRRNRPTCHQASLDTGLMVMSFDINSQVCLRQPIWLRT